MTITSIFKENIKFICLFNNEPQNGSPLKTSNIKDFISLNGHYTK